ncbi:MAG: single-stranded-DNA-specific exonuclease RecJ [Lachnospiraceae bacterium]|nr:single-stranded-DNA-specific exonuclease RecJ [Lachnospiraceae bacterium]
MKQRKKWMIYSKRANFEEIAKTYQVDKVIARIIRNRDVIGEEAIRRYLYGTKEDMYDPFLLKDMEKAIPILKEKILTKKKIRIIGDYDIDGVSSIYILLTAFQRCGAVVDGEIPHRIKDGYGINEGLIQKASLDGVDTIVTCDNGISAVSQIAYAKSLGMTVIVTDHHEVPYEDTDGKRHYILPPADAIVNPKQEGCRYPFKGLCGAAVAYKLVLCLYQAFGREKAEAEEEFLEIAAMATVGDVMDLQDENRILVKEGLKRFQHTHNQGLRSLMAICQIAPETISSYHIGFIIGPCLNAGGRLDTAKRALALLQAEEKETADNLAGELKALNESRKKMTADGVEQAVKEIESSDQKEDKVLVVYLPDCHESLAGIIAGRLREKYYKPVFVLTKGEEYIKGSGRSIEEYSMFDELVKSKEYLVKFGGHPMAAGLSLEEKNIVPFRKSLNERQQMTEDDLIEKVWIDTRLPFGYITEELVEQFALLLPFGKGNEKPVFAERNVKILYRQVLGINRNVVRMQLESEGIRMEGVWFGEGDMFLKETEGVNTFSILFFPEINTYRGNRTLQIRILEYQV